MRRFIVLSVLVGAGALTMAIVRAQPTQAPIQLQKVQDRVRVLSA